MYWALAAVIGSSGSRRTLRGLKETRGDDAVLVSSLLYGSKTWVYQKKNERKMNSVETRFLRRICGVSLAD